MKGKLKSKPQARVKPTEAGKKEVDEHVLMEAELELTVKNKDGKVSHHSVRKSESFVRAWLELLYAHAVTLQWPGIIIRDTSDTERQAVASSIGFDVSAPDTNIDYGILIGAGVAAPTIDDFGIEDLIEHGVGFDQLQYSDVVVAYPGVNVNVSQLTITRNFSNASGAAVTVNEIGMVCRATDTAGTVRYFLIIRDITPGGLPVPDGETLTVNYRLLAEI